MPHIFPDTTQADHAADAIHPAGVRPCSASRRHLLAAALGGAGMVVLPRAATAVALATPLPLTARTTEGPFYFDPRRERADITEGQPGVPLEVRFTVLDPRGQPLAGTRVDLWHCNAAGVYSGYAGQRDDSGRPVSTRGETFLRGNQPVAADGVATFRTIYPGWYPGRTTHLHVKVLQGSRAILTTQCFLPDTVSEYLYTQLPAYRRARVRETLNNNDGIALRAGDTVLGAVRELADRYVATMTLVVDPAASPVADRPPIRGPEGRASGRPAPPPPEAPRDAPAEGAARAAALVPGQAR